MICKKTVKKFCKEPIKIENYDKAVNDITQVWQCHHYLETHNSDGEKRPVFLTKDELTALDMYYNRPPNEFIFLTQKEHSNLHKLGNPHPHKGHKGARSKMVMCVETGQVFDSISDVANFLGIKSHKAIRKYLNTNISYHGYMWTTELSKETK